MVSRGRGRRLAVHALPVVLVVVFAGCLAGTGPAAPTDAGPTPTLTGNETVAPDVGTTATVVRIVDGDTIVVELADGTEEKIRLVGVDTPEVHTEVSPDEFGIPETESGRSCLRDWGDRASEFAKRHLDGRTVQLVPDDNLPERGYYGRLLAYVYVDGVSFNHALIESGHARVFRSEFTRRPAFEATQRRAQSDRRGLWACRDVEGTPTDSETGIAVATIVADAPGDDNENLNGEYVVFENRGDEPLDVGGWTVRDGADHEYRFAAGTVLEPGERITLYTGSGTDTDTERYWGRSSAVWNNGGDTVVVVDDAGRTVLRDSY